MRLTCVIHSLDGGGAERVLARLASMLAARGHQVTLITLDDGRRDRHAVADAVQRVYLGLAGTSRNRLQSLAATGRRWMMLRRAIKRSRPDRVLSFCDVTNCLTLLATIGMPVPVVVSERSDPASQRLTFPWQTLRPWLYRRAAAVVVLTPAAAATVASWHRDQPVVIASAVDPPSDSDSAADDRRAIVAVGRLEREKGFDLLLEAFAPLAQRYPAIDLVIYGEGSQRASLQAQRAALGLEQRVSLPGWVSPIGPRLSAGQIFVLPSRYEGFPSALLEAMAAGMACIATDCPSGPAAIIRDQHDGCLVASQQPAALTAAIEALLQSPQRCRQLGQAARSVSERFGWQAMVQAYEQVLLK